MKEKKAVINQSAKGIAVLMDRINDGHITDEISIMWIKSIDEKLQEMYKSMKTNQLS